MTEQQRNSLLGIAHGRALVAAVIFLIVMIWPAGFYQSLVYSVFAYVVAFIWYRWRLFRQAVAIEKQPKA